jgi:EAL domain-containing protein (putative c-di-GMP-specific phosphodiesterase class I)/GGDEF domain-containing protein
MYGIQNIDLLFKQIAKPNIYNSESCVMRMFKNNRDNKEKVYISMIQENLQSGLNWLILISAFVLFIAAFTILYSPIPDFYFLLDIILGILMLIISIFRNQIPIETQISAAVLVPIIIGISSFLDGGFNSSGITLILISNVMAIMLFSRRTSIKITFLSIFIFILLWIISSTFLLDKFSYIRTAEWIVQFIVFLLFLTVYQLMVSRVRNFLITNIIQVEESNEKIYHLAYYDSVTNLPNLYSLKDQLSLRDTQNNFDGFFLIYFIKNSDVINSIYGVEEGNQLLIELGNVFSNQITSNDILIKSGEKEFGFLLEKKSKNELSDWINTTNKSINDFYSHSTHIKPEFIISYFECNSYNQTVNDYYEKAKIALTYAKTNSISGIISYNSLLEKKLCEEENLRKLLLNSIENKDFSIYYQPKVDVITGEVTGVEALSRWHAESLGYISPEKFIPLIEKINKSIEFGQFVINQVFSDYEMICKKYNNLISIAINISPSHLLSEGFVEFLSEKINEYKISAEKLVIEITEEVMIQDESHTNEIIKTIHAFGIRISLDDFGSGYSSFNYLMILDINELKIDKSFIHNMFNNKKTIVLLKSIIKIAQEYNLILIAEGVETKKQQDYLLELGCHIMQGYYFSKPEPL